MTWACLPSPLCAGLQHCPLSVPKTHCVLPSGASDSRLLLRGRLCPVPVSSRCPLRPIRPQPNHRVLCAFPDPAARRQPPPLALLSSFISFITSEVTCSRASCQISPPGMWLWETRGCQVYHIFTALSTCLGFQGHSTNSRGNGDFPGRPVIRTLSFHCRGHGFDPWSGKLRSGS